MANIFSTVTLKKFEDASASIPLRQLVRAFEAVGMRLGEDPGGADGARKVQFRRYVAGVDQRKPQQLKQLGAALGALIDEVATSKQDYLIKAAELDGFIFADGAFRAAATAPRKDAIAEAAEQLESACRTILRLAGMPAPGKTAGLAKIAASALAALEERR
jgi:hypothetical protein